VLRQNTGTGNGPGYAFSPAFRREDGGHVGAGYCPDNESLPQPLNQMSFVSQNGLGSQVTLALSPPSNWNFTTFVPALQREDGSYLGTDWEGNLDAVGLDGSVVWQQQIGSSPLTPLYATADGGVIATSTSQCSHNIVTDSTCSPVLGTLYTLDKDGNVTSQTPDTGATYSWTDQSYAASGTGASAFASPQIPFALTYQAISGGNPSSSIVSIGFGGRVEGKSIWARFMTWVSGGPKPSCSLGIDKVPLSGEALQQYSTMKQSLLSGGFLTCPSCAAFFSAPVRSGYCQKLVAAVTNQVPYDGLRTNISRYEAGLYPKSEAGKPTSVSIFKKTPVCGVFGSFVNSGGKVVIDKDLVTAAAQAANPPGTDVYINPNDLGHLTQGTILHEVLHNLTGLADFESIDLATGFHPLDLKTFVGIENAPGVDPNPSVTSDITTQLEVQKCAGTN